MHPYLTYGILIWGSARPTNLQKLVVLQKKAIRCITNSKYNEHTAPLFKRLLVPNLTDLFHIQLGLFMYNQYHGLLPLPLLDMYNNNYAIHTYNTRQQLDFHLPSVKIDIVFRSFVYQAPLLWSKLPDAFKQLHTSKSFKSHLKKHYLNMY